MRFVWIEDDRGRKRMSDALEEELGVRVDFEDARGHEIHEVLTKLLGRPKPDLAIVDHFLTAARGEGRLLARGSSVAEALRQEWHDCPIVGITGAAKRQDIDVHKEHVYDELHAADRFRHFAGCLRIMATGFKAVSARRIVKVDDILELLRTPADDTERLRKSLPDDLKGDLSDCSVATRLYAWLRAVLFERPGFLLDRMWTATLTGIKESSFSKVERLLRPAKYTGIFAYPNRERWWAGMVREIIYTQCAPTGSEMPWELGHRLPGVDRGDHSRCAASGEDLPETVAFLDAQTDKLAPMRLRYTVPDPRFGNLLFFEELRMMGENGDV